MDPVEKVTFDDFAKLDLRVAKILSAEKVEKSNKLLKLSIQVGDEIRTIVAGIAEHYSAEQVIGKTIIVVANLEPRKLRGIESQGMLLAASSTANGLVLVSLDKEVETGAKVG